MVLSVTGVMVGRAFDPMTLKKYRITFAGSYGRVSAQEYGIVPLDDTNSAVLDAPDAAYLRRIFGGSWNILEVTELIEIEAEYRVIFNRDDQFDTETVNKMILDKLQELGAGIPPKVDAQMWRTAVHAVVDDMASRGASADLQVRVLNECKAESWVDTDVTADGTPEVVEEAKVEALGVVFNGITKEVGPEHVAQFLDEESPDFGEIDPTEDEEIDDTNDGGSDDSDVGEIDASEPGAVAEGISQPTRAAKPRRAMRKPKSKGRK